MSVSTTQAHSPAEFAVEAHCEAITERIRGGHPYSYHIRDIDRTAQFDALQKNIGNTALEPILGSILSGTRVYTKREYTNLSGSHYDRAYLQTLHDFERTGFITPEVELRDITSGSGGISLAVLASALGYDARVTVPAELPSTRTLPLRHFNATVVNAGPGYMKQASAFQAAEIQTFIADPAWRMQRPSNRGDRAIRFDHRTGDERSVCYLNHSENDLTRFAFQNIGRELVGQLAEAPQAVVLAIGNWTTIAGITPKLRHHWPDTKIIGYHGENTDIHDNFGTRVDDIKLRFKDEDLLDDILTISNEERDAFDKVNEWRSLFDQIGHSSLMGLAAADRLAQDSGGDIVTIAYDQKIRY